MTITETTQILTSFASMVTAGAALWASLRNARKIDVQAGDIKKIEIATNSMKDALVKATGEAAHAAGLAEGKAFEQKVSS
jgi:hypothetical protein